MSAATIRFKNSLEIPEFQFTYEKEGSLSR